MFKFELFVQLMYVMYVLKIKMLVARRVLYFLQLLTAVLQWATALLLRWVGFLFSDFYPNDKTSETWNSKNKQVTQHRATQHARREDFATFEKYQIT